MDLNPNSQAWHNANQRAYVVAFAITVAAKYMHGKWPVSDEMETARNDMEYDMSRLMQEALNFPQGLDGIRLAASMFSEDIV